MFGVSAAQIIGGNSSIGRKDSDFYETPKNVTEALVNFLENTIGTYKGKDIWEPAAGKGKIAEVLETSGYHCIMSDIKDYGLSYETKNFYEFKEPLADWIITNPPFMLAEMFIKKSITLEVGMFCLLLKSTYWHAATRLELFNNCSPSYILPLTWRPDFRGLGAPTMDLCWNVWNRNKQKTRYILLKKPKI